MKEQPSEILAFNSMYNIPWSLQKQKKRNEQQNTQKKCESSNIFEKGKRLRMRRRPRVCGCTTFRGNKSELTLETAREKKTISKRKQKENLGGPWEWQAMDRHKSRMKPPSTTTTSNLPKKQNSARDSKTKRKISVNLKLKLSLIKERNRVCPPSHN